jgi:hypothetical protein
VIQGKVSDVDESDRLVKSGQVPEKFVDEIAATVSHYLDI